MANLRQARLIQDEPLTARERQLLAMLRRGDKYRKIARVLGCSSNTLPDWIAVLRIKTGKPLSRRGLQGPGRPVLFRCPVCRDAAWAWSRAPWQCPTHQS